MGGLQNTLTKRALWGAFVLAAALVAVACDNPTSSSNGGSGSVHSEIGLEMRTAELSYSHDLVQTVTIELSSEEVTADGSLDPNSNRLVITVMHSGGSQTELPEEEYMVVDLDPDSSPDDEWYLAPILTQLQYLDEGSLQQFAAVGGSMEMQDDADRRVGDERGPTRRRRFHDGLFRV